MGIPLVRFTSVALVCLFVLQGCAHKFSPAQPSIEYPASFIESVTGETQASAEAIDEAWWKSFQAPPLNQLVADAINYSPDWLITNERVYQAEYQLRIANASWFPLLTLGGSTGERSTKEPGQPSVHSGSTNASLSMNYEIDLWGGIAANRRAANADYDAIRFEQEAVRLSIQGAVAIGWFQWLALQERITTAEKNIEIAERVMGIVEVRYKNGSASAAEVAQQKTNLLSQRANLLPLQLQARQTKSALAILVGKTPQSFSLPNMPLQQLDVPVIVPGTPAQLVLRRPDLAAVEARLSAADANVAQARAAMFPTFSLNASTGKSASELFSLNPATQTSLWSLSFAQTLFSGGRLINQKRLTESRRAELLLQYRKAILTALQEVDNAMAAADIGTRQESSQSEIVLNAERSLQLTEARYRAGSDSLLSLLDAQRSLFQAKDVLVQQRLSRLIAAVELYKALGGGWQLKMSN